MRSIQNLLCIVEKTITIITRVIEHRTGQPSLFLLRVLSSTLQYTICSRDYKYPYLHLNYFVIEMGTYYNYLRLIIENLKY